MSLKYLKNLLTILIMPLIFTCRHPYEPSVIKNNLKYLVVNGFINSGSNASKSCQFFIFQL
ncbi:MAG: hypothetical protein C5B59_14590 [Bacteroidetes bacterium]|nr:MAG: hypothetical protein C5B59_14590 [Bacteroidota bacterium]